MDGHRHIGFPLGRLGPALGLLLALALLSGCESRQSREAKEFQTALKQPLNVLAEDGDIEAMRVVADIEVLRAQSVFSDSAANALSALPASAFIGLDVKGQPIRIERGEDLTDLLAYTAEEQTLLKTGDITPAQAAELRRLAIDNLAAAAEKSKKLRTHRGSGLP